MKAILGISAFYHDSAAAIIVDGEILAAAQEERFTRKKHTADFPVESIRFCLKETGLELDDLEAVVFYDKSLLKFERLLDTYYAFSPRGLVSFIKAIPVWLNEKLFLKRMIREGLREVEPYQTKKLKLLFSEHHLSHAASAFYPSPFSEAAILTIDGVGEWCTASISHGKDNTITLLKEMHFPHSVGLLYSSFTYYLGFTVNSGEYKLMGLAPYGNPEDQETLTFIQKIRESLVKIYPDGSIWLNPAMFSYATGLRMVNEKKWTRLFGFGRRLPESEIKPCHCNLALAIQIVTEEIVILMAREAKRMTGSDRLCMAGGVALNCVANGKLLREGLFKEIYIQPASGDAGGSLGCALAAWHLYLNEKRIPAASFDGMKGSYLGPDFSDQDIEKMCRRSGANFLRFDHFSELADHVAGKIAEGHVVGWFQGKMEFGPRALGNRSILADPRNPEMQKKLNLKIKYREGFRPFAPSVLAGDREHYFDLKTDSPYMLLVAEVAGEQRYELPEDFSRRSLWDRLYFKRSKIQSVTHLDFSARVQTVHKETNPRYYELIQSFKDLTGTGLLINTSFNVRGEPMVCTPEDAYRCFMGTEMDYLVIGNYVFEKTQQEDWENRSRWSQEFKPD